MSVTYYGTFSEYKPTEFPMVPPEPDPVPAGLEGDELAQAQAQYERMVMERLFILNRFQNDVQWIRNEFGQDFYELRKSMPTSGSYVTLNDDGRIRIVHDDPHRVWPSNGGRLYHVDAVLPVSAADRPVGLEGKLFDPETGAISDPPVPRIVSVSAAQAKVALFRTRRLADGSLSRDQSAAGTDLLTLTKQAISGYPPDVQLWFDNAREWERENSYVVGIGLELDLSESAMDDLFTYAKTLSA